MSEEDIFIDYAESIIQSLQKVARGKTGMAFVPVLETCSKLEEMAYQESQKDSSLAPLASVWQHPGAMDIYQDLCETILRNLETISRKDWLSKFTENPPIKLFRLLSGRSGQIGFVGSNFGGEGGSRRQYVDAIDYSDDIDERRRKKLKKEKLKRRKHAKKAS